MKVPEHRLSILRVADSDEAPTEVCTVDNRETSHRACEDQDPLEYGGSRKSELAAGGIFVLVVAFVFSLGFYWYLQFLVKIANLFNGN